MTAANPGRAESRAGARVRAGSLEQCPTCGVEIRVFPSAGLVPAHRPRPDAAQCVASGRKFVRPPTPTTPSLTRKTRHVCAKCGLMVEVGASGRVYNHKDRRTGERCPGSRLKVGPGRRKAGQTRKDVGQARPGLSGPPAPDPEESVGRRPGPCPVCGATVAYDDELRMNQHCFKESNAECVASDREYGWMPETVEDGLPKRQRGGGPIPSKDLERVRRVVTKAVALHRDAQRAGERMFAKRAEARRAAISRKNARARPATSSTAVIIRCSSCGLEFQRPAGDSSRRCTICDPPRSTSVRAYRGGLPGLGRRA